MSKKPIIVFEGIEGSGKTFHLNNIARYLKKKRISFIKIREPGGNYNSEKIRKLILNKNSNFNPTTDLLLYLAARNENINIIIKKYFKKKVILIDRFVDSTIAYQHYGMNINLKIINILNSFLLSKIKPHFTFLNIVNSQNMIDRLKKRKNLNRYDNFKIIFYKKVQKGYLALSKKNKKKYLVVDSNREININKKIILNKIIELIK